MKVQIGDFELFLMKSEIDKFKELQVWMRNENSF
jgi:hypothetical protein